MQNFIFLYNILRVLNGKILDKIAWESRPKKLLPGIYAEF